MMKYIILFRLIFQNYCVLMSLKDRCACSEYEQIYCTVFPYCSWDSTAKTCGHLVCSQKEYQELCDGINSEFHCKWNTATSTCEDYNYQCSDLAIDDCFNFYVYGINCEWYDDKCQTYSCNNQGCDFLSCSYSYSDGCSEPKSLPDCSQYENSQDCDQMDGNGNICSWNADKCEKLSLLSNCSDYSDFPDICELTCTYDSENNVCRSSSCADFLSEFQCQAQIDLNDFGIIPCIWKNDTCSDASESDIQNFDIFSCSKNTLFHYKWSDNTCVQCSQTETSPLFKFITDKIITDLDSTLLSIFGLILILY